MAGRLLIFSRWIALALLVLAVSLIIVRWKFPVRGGSPPMGGYAWYKAMLAAWLNHRQDQRERAANLRALRGKTALLVDPDPKSLRVMTWKLERLGCIVLKAKNGAQALSQARETTIDIGFVDALLPDISASDFYYALSGSPAPVVFLGVLENQWDTLRALGTSVACLSKPYNPDEATSQAGRLLRYQSQSEVS